MITPVLSIQNLSVQFTTMDGTIRAVEEIDLDIKKGEIVAVVGESGSGKSVTSMSVLKLHPSLITQYSSGKIFLQQQEDKALNLLTCGEKALQEVRGNSIAMIFQEPMTSLNPIMRCGLQITEAIQQHKKLNFTAAKKEAISLLEAVQIPNPEKSFDKYPSELSGGQKQRVMIAMAMCCKPEILICDEPTTALDVTVQKNILQLIKNLQLQNQMGVLFISHDLGLVSAIADTIVVMYKGRIVEKGTAQHILHHPTHPYTKALLACRPALYPKGRRLPVVADFLAADGEKTNTLLPKETAPIPIDSSAKKETLFTVNDLTITYPIKRNFFGKIISSFTAVNKVSFSIYKGETLGLVGESGCGKTTIGRTILRLITPTSGDILYQHKSIIHLSAENLEQYRREVQIVFQDPYSSLNPRKTVGAAIMEPILLHGLASGKKAAKELVLELLQKVELKPEHFNRYPHEFSGGQRQRIVIARALAMRPKFLVCDESVSALDVSVQAQILNLLNDLKKQYGFTILFISHDLAVVKYISDRIMVMQNGTIIETNTAEELFQHPKEAYTLSLLDAIPGLKTIPTGGNA